MVQKEGFQTAQSKERFNSVRWMCTTQRSFSECVCLVLRWTYFLFHHKPQSAANIHLQIPQKGFLQSTQSKGRFDSARWKHSSQRNFSESFCLVYMWNYFIFHYRPQRPPNIHLQIPQRYCFQTVQSKESFNSVRRKHTSQRSFSEIFSLVFMWRYLLFHYRPQRAQKYPFADSTKRLFQYCSFKRKVQHCEMNAHITKKFLRMLLSSFYVKIFPFPL